MKHFGSLSILFSLMAVHCQLLGQVIPDKATDISPLLIGETALELVYNPDYKKRLKGSLLMAVLNELK